MKRIGLLVLALTVILPLRAAAQQVDLIDADRPGIADSGKTLDRGRLQVEAGFQQDVVRDGDLRAHVNTLPVLLRYGLANHFELRAESATFTRQQGDHGVAPLTLGFKSQLAGSDNEPLRDFGFIGSVTLPSGTGIVRQSTTTGRLVAAADVSPGGKWAINPNVGAASFHGSNGKSRFAVAAAVTVEYDITERIHPAVEVARVEPDEGENRGTTIVNAQFAWIVAPAVQLDAEIGRNTADRKLGYVTAGVSYRIR